MGSDTKGKGITETIAEEAKGVAVEVYKDAAKPALAAAGDTLGRLVRLALRPIELLAQGGERLMSAVERKLGGVPEDRLLPPPATIAAPAALHYALLGEGDEVAALREMFENLLVSSMDSQTAPSAHPAFVSMIAQLTPDEAWLLKSVDRTRYEYVDLGPEGLQTVLGVGIGINESSIDFYISNLIRLGIFQLHTGMSDVYPNAPPELRNLIEARFPNPNTRILHKLQFLLWMHVTPLGIQFLKACANNIKLC